MINSIKILFFITFILIYITTETKIRVKSKILIIKVDLLILLLEDYFLNRIIIVVIITINIWTNYFGFKVKFF